MRPQAVSSFLRILMALSALILINGCSTTNPRHHVDRYRPTPQKTQPTVTALLSSYGNCSWPETGLSSKCHGSTVYDKDTAYKLENEFSSYFYSGIKEVIPAVVLLNPQEGRIRFFGTETAASPPVDSDAILSVLKSANKSNHSSKYIVLIKINTREDEYKTRAVGSWLLWFWGREWRRETTCSAYIIDVANSHLAGEIASTVSGYPGYAVPMLIVIPLLPIPMLSPTESEACTDLGKEVGKFLNETVLTIDAK